MQGARTKEISTRYLKGRDPIEKQSVWPSKQVPWVPGGPRREARGEMENWKSQGRESEEKKGEQESAKEKNRKCGKSERII